MGCAHHHDHSDHNHGRGETSLGIALLITASYMIAEVVGGFLFNSLALLADAGHMFSDAMALGLSWVALRIGKRSATDRHTFGFRRTEILAALFNGLALWAIAGVIVYEAAHRFLNPSPVAGGGMLAVAAVGLIVNLVMVALLFRDRKTNLNIRGAFLHVVSDALGSVGAIAAALIILATGFYMADPLVSVLICVLILYSSWGLIKESVHILMEGVPSEVELPAIEKALLSGNGVCCVYDLHVWSISSNRTALSAHVVLSDPKLDPHETLEGLNDILAEKFQITHTTIQVETTHSMRSHAEGLLCREGTVCNGGVSSRGNHAQASSECGKNHTV